MRAVYKFLWTSQNLVPYKMFKSLTLIMVSNLKCLSTVLHKEWYIKRVVLKFPNKLVLVEHKNQQILNVIRALRFQAKFILNSSLIVVLLPYILSIVFLLLIACKTPYELLFSSFQIMITFVCLVVCVMPPLHY